MPVYYTSYYKLKYNAKLLANNKTVKKNPKYYNTFHKNIVHTKYLIQDKLSDIYYRYKSICNKIKNYLCIN